MSYPATVHIGLTGGIGSGKSTVAGLLAERGARIIDADAISRELTAAGGRAIPLILNTFGSSFIDADGALKRERMRMLVYSNTTAKTQLEAIIHPLVASTIQHQASDALSNKCKVIVYDIPLLVESQHWRERVDQLLVVDTTPEVQINRVMNRNGITRLEIQKIIASQVTRQRRLRSSDAVISNITLSLRQLACEVQHLAKRFGLSCQ